MVLHPSFFAGKSLGLVRRGLHFDFAQVVSKLVVSDDECISLSCILDAVGVVVVLGGCLDHDPVRGHLVERGHRVRQFRYLHVLQAERDLLFPLVHLCVVEEVFRQEADHFVPILDPELDGDLDSFAGEALVLAVPHCHVLGI